LICLLSFLCCCLVPSLLFFTLLPLPLSPSSHLVSLSPPSHLVSPRSLSLVELQASAQTQTHTHTHTRTHTLTLTLYVYKHIHVCSKCLTHFEITMNKNVL